MNWKLLPFFIAGFIFIGFAAFVSKTTSNTEFEAAKEIIILRKIAHEVLLNAGDSSSRILPVNTVSANQFQIPFESSFSFKPDSLVRIINEVMQASKLSSNYVVSVIDPSSEKVIFGYAMLGSEKNNIVPCLGRKQPSMRYLLNIKFQDRDDAGNTSKKGYLAGIALLACGFVMAGVQLYKQKRSGVPVTTTDISATGNAIPIGKYLFYPEEQSLVFMGATVILTSKESKLLGLFAASSNQVIDRNDLQKIWEDEGVIVGRSLDMFVSKLRKKLEQDPALKLVNIHGKGYKLEISPA